MEPDHVGFTGSLRGMTERQTISLTMILQSRILPIQEERWLHHGCCVGSDAQAHKIAKSLGYKIHLHPPLDRRLMMEILDEGDMVDPPYSYQGRNQRIALASRLVVVVPRMGSVGTWNCAEAAAKLRRPRMIIREDGRTDEYDLTVRDH